MGSTRAVFFDAGGTLIHPDPVFLLESLAEQGIQRNEGDLRGALAAAGREVARTAASANPGTDASRTVVFWGTLFDALGCDAAVRDALRPRVLARHQEGRLWTWTAPGTLDLLQDLRSRGLTVAVISNSDGGVERYLTHAGLREALDFVIDSGRVGFEKPDPRIFALALRQAQVTASDALHVGDVYDIDVVGARRAGIRPVLLAADGAAGADCDVVRALDEVRAFLVTGTKRVPALR